MWSENRYPELHGASVLMVRRDPGAPRPLERTEIKKAVTRRDSSVWSWSMLGIAAIKVQGHWLEASELASLRSK